MKVKMMSEVPIDTLLEATLFGAGRSMSVSELSSALGYDEDEMLELEKITKNITDSISILIEKKLDLFSSTVNNN